MVVSFLQMHFQLGMYVFCSFLLFSFNGYAANVESDVPKEVLVGTDVVSLGGFERVGSITDGQYTAEIGGARLMLSVKSLKGELEIARVYQEPGMAYKTKSYKIKYSKESTIKNDFISLVATRDGLLLHEVSPGVDGIPDALWLFYAKK